MQRLTLISCRFVMGVGLIGFGLAAPRIASAEHHNGTQPSSGSTPRPAHTNYGNNFNNNNRPAPVYQQPAPVYQQPATQPAHVNTTTPQSTTSARLSNGTPTTQHESTASGQNANHHEEEMGFWHHFWAMEHRKHEREMAEERHEHANRTHQTTPSATAHSTASTSLSSRSMSQQSSPYKNLIASLDKAERYLKGADHDYRGHREEALQDLMRAKEALSLSSGSGSSTGSGSSATHAAPGTLSSQSVSTSGQGSSRPSTGSTSSRSHGVNQGASDAYLGAALQEIDNVLMQIRTMREEHHAHGESARKSLDHAREQIQNALAYR